MTFQKLFTPQEANERLPLIKQIVFDILKRGKTLQAMATEFEGDLPKRGLKLQDELESLMRELENLGCYFKDWNFEIGLVDFPSEINGEVVFLCWRSDEPNVSWYHSIHTGYAGRSPIPEHLL